MFNIDFKNKRNRNLLILLMIGLVSLAVRLLIEHEFDRSALLYVGIPYLVAIALLFIDRSNPHLNWKRRYLNICITSLIIMLGSSIILFEGFVCVVMFMPIYFFVILLMFIFEAIRRWRLAKSHGRNYVQLLPLIVVLSTFEGVIPNYEFEREYEISVSMLVEASVKEIKHKLIKPIDLDVSRHWMLSLFPMPYDIEAESLSPGDIHKIHFMYHRWFFTNSHQGSMELLIDEVDEHYIQTKFVKDTSYISNYLKLHGTEIYLEPVDDLSTKVTLKISYHRFLDPVWYFGPLQEFAITKSAQFLIEQVITPDVSISRS